MQDVLTATQREDRGVLLRRSEHHNNPAHLCARRTYRSSRKQFCRERESWLRGLQSQAAKPRTRVTERTVLLASSCAGLSKQSYTDRLKKRKHPRMPHTAIKHQINTAATRTLANIVTQHSNATPKTYMSAAKSATRPVVFVFKIVALCMCVCRSEIRATRPVCY